MRICLVLEGSYPYVHGGVSSWMHQVISDMPEHEFVLWVIGAHASSKGKFVYELPSNVKEVQEVFLDDALHIRMKKRMNHKFTNVELEALRSLIECERPDWDVLFELYQVRKLNPLSFLRSEAFLKLLTSICQKRYPYSAFADTFHTIRSMLLPVLYLMGTPVPQADVYHSICTGYGGLLATMGASLNHKPLLLTEHGIYTREREEEIIRAKWVPSVFKNRWIRFFYMLSDAIYSRAFRVTCLFSDAVRIQCELGCSRSKCRVIQNGIIYERFSKIPPKQEDGWIDIGAMIRLAPIKDVKTLLYAFYELSTRISNVRLHVMGGVDDEEYAQECYELAKQLGIENVLFTGRVDVLSYMEKLDFTVLSSISEGQPLSVLESFAAGRPCVTTDVGCCRALLEGEPGDTLGQAGYCVPAMNRGKMADAMETLCTDGRLRYEMGEAGRQRVKQYYHREQMMKKYRMLYEEVATTYGRHRI